MSKKKIATQLCVTKYGCRCGYFKSGAISGGRWGRKLLAGRVRASLAAAPALSVRARAAALRVPRSTLRALLAAELRAHVPAGTRIWSDLILLF